ncbi:MAG: uroporphyrinogen decarboxylase family protein [Candidatus Brocadiia bacterium]
MSSLYEPLSREQVAAVVEGSGDSRPPAYMHKWPGEGLREYHGAEAVQEVFAPYPDDVVAGNVIQPGGWEAPEGFAENYRWAWKDKSEGEGGEKHGHDSGGRILEDMDELDAFLDDFPRADNPAVFEPVREAVERSNGQYVIGWAWNNFYERLWGIRGMQYILMDFHINPEKTKRLCEALLDLVLKFVEGVAEAGADGFATSNDLGHQTGLMMSPEKFREFLKPLHVEVARACHEHGLHYWMHSCGNLTDVVEDMIELELDCLHPLQYGAMDWCETAELIDGRMTAWPGIDVQHILQEEDPEGVREHVRDLIDTFYIPGRGRCVVAAGNGITGSTPLENIDAFLDETFRYGLEITHKG